MTALTRQTFRSPDDCDLSYLAGGEGRTVVLVHGFVASAQMNWVAPGIAEKVIAAGFRVVAPDLRGHGRSAHPTGAQAWPLDVLATDLEALVTHLGLTNFDLVGYSLGARTAARALVRGMRPRRAVLGGMGDTGVMEAGARAAMFRDAIVNGEAGANPAAGRVIRARMAAEGLDAASLLGVLDSFVATTRADLANVPTPVLVVCGERDQDNGSAEGLAAILPNARAVSVPGDHLTAVAAPELASQIVGFLTAP